MILDDARLWIPPVWEHDWERAVAEVDVGERPLVETQKTLVGVLQKIKDATLTPSVLAWLMIWSRLFACCEAARGACTSGSLLALHMASRVELEAFLHLIVLTEPDGLAAVRSRFEAYTAWTMACDVKLLREGLADIQALFDPVPARDLVRRLGHRLPEWEAKFGAIDTESDAEAVIEMEKHAESATRKVARLEMWLTDTRLAHWAAKVFARKGNVTLFELFSEDERYVRMVMDRRGFGHLYLVYMAGSGTIHGSSFQAVCVHGDNDVMPIIGNFQQRLETEATQIAEQIRLAAPILDLARRHL